MNDVMGLGLRKMKCREERNDGDESNEQSSIENADTNPKSTGILTYIAAIIFQSINDDIKSLRHIISPNLSK